MLCHNYRRVPAVALAKRLIEEGRLGTHPPFPRHLPAGLDRRSGLPARLAAREGARRARARSATSRSHSLDLARYLVGEIAEVIGPAQDVHHRATAARGPKTKAPVDVDDAALALVRFANGAIGSVEGIALRPRPQELQPLRDQRQQGQPGLRPRAHERARALHRRGPRTAASARSSSPTPNTPTSRRWWPPGHIIGYEHTFTHTVRDLVAGVHAQKLPTPELRGRRRRTSACSTPSNAPPSSGRWEKV